MRRRPDHRRARRVGAGLLALTVLAASCTGDDDEPAATPSTTTTQPPREREDDGVLRIGALVPLSDPTVGTGLVSSFEAAVEAVNDAGGVLGRDVEMFVQDEGTTPATAADATETLIDRGADAIIGPTSSNVAIAALDSAVAAGVVMCSATASSIALDEFPDQNLFFRSIATDSLQAAAIAVQARNRGASRVVVIHIDDAYGQPYATAVDDAFEEAPSILVQTVAVPVGDDDLQDDLDLVAAARADTGIVLGSGDDIARLLEALDARDDIDFTQIIVNDAARALPTRPVIAGLDPEFRERIVGLAPRIVPPQSAEDERAAPFANQVTDCVNFIALAVAQGGSDAPSTFATQMTSVSAGGIVCPTFAECVALIDAGEQINYNPPSRPTVLARDGDPSRAFFDLFVFDEDGVASNQGTVAPS